MTDRDKAQALAELITNKAEAALADLEREMAIRKWAPEFRAIMWGAVADIAFKRKVEAEDAARVTTGDRHDG